MKQRQCGMVRWSVVTPGVIDGWQRETLQLKMLPSDTAYFLCIKSNFSPLFMRCTVCISC